MNHVFVILNYIPSGSFIQLSNPGGWCTSPFWRWKCNDSECYSNKELHKFSSWCLSLYTIGLPVQGNSLITSPADPQHHLEWHAGVYPCLRISTQIAHRRCYM